MLRFDVSNTLLISIETFFAKVTLDGLAITAEVHAGSFTSDDVAATPLNMITESGA